MTVVHQLVLQDNVYAIFDGLGTPTHLAVVTVPEQRRRCRTCSSRPAATAGTTRPSYPRRSAGRSTTSARARSSAQYIKQHFTGKKIGFFYQNDEFGQDGVKGLDDEIPAKQIVSRQSLRPDQHQHRPAVAALKASGAQVVVSFSIPAFTALLKLTASS